MLWLGLNRALTLATSQRGGKIRARTRISQGKLKLCSLCPKSCWGLHCSLALLQIIFVRLLLFGGFLTQVLILVLMIFSTLILVLDFRSSLYLHTKGIKGGSNELSSTFPEPGQIQEITKKDIILNTSSIILLWADKFWYKKVE